MTNPTKELLDERHDDYVELVEKFLDDADVYREFRNNCSICCNEVEDAPQADAWYDDLLQYAKENNLEPRNDLEKKMLFELWDKSYTYHLDDLCESALEWHYDREPDYDDWGD